MTRLLITYTDPETGEPAEHIGDYVDTPDTEVGLITAREWAEDHAYTLADKGWFEIKELRVERSISSPDRSI